MTGHSTANDDSRRICDEFFISMQNTIPNLTRTERKKPCAFHQLNNNRFAYVYHSRNSVLVFFRGNHMDSMSKFPKKLSIKKRDKITGNWQREFPFSVTIRDVGNMVNFCQFLVDYSFPLSERKAGKKSRQGTRLPTTLSEEVLPRDEYTEGSVQKILVNRYERDARARDACIAALGTSCSICGFDFAVEFGEIMRGFIHVHHLKSLSSIGNDYNPDPLADLCPVCPNCHGVIHHRNPPYSIEEVQMFRSSARRRTTDDR